MKNPLAGMGNTPNITVKAVAAYGLHWTSRKRAALYLKRYEMRFRQFAPLLLLLCSPLAVSGEVDVCTKTAQTASREKAFIPSYMSGRKVVGKGRLYFYVAPQAKCRTKGTFIIPGDRVEAYAVYGRFTEVTYWEAKGGDVEGWVLSDRLVATGTGIGNKEEQEGQK